MRNELDYSPLVFAAANETEFKRVAGEVAVAWRAQAPTRLVVGLDGPLGAGKTTWVRGMLEGLGHDGRVPSPTYTMLEYYELNELTFVHLDLYRLSGEDPAGGEGGAEFEALGVRDWLERNATWVFAEWPTRSPQLVAGCDVWVELEFLGDCQRRVTLAPRLPAGQVVVERLRGASPFDSSYKR